MSSCPICSSLESAVIPNLLALPVIREYNSISTSGLYKEKKFPQGINVLLNKTQRQLYPVFNHYVNAVGLFK